MTIPGFEYTPEERIQVRVLSAVAKEIETNLLRPGLMVPAYEHGVRDAIQVIQYRINVMNPL